MKQPIVFDIFKMSAHDGPGMRTVVFLKGCPLRCRWCHNPESFSPRPEVWTFPEKCIGCGRCVEACPAGAIGFDRAGLPVIDRRECTGCGACADVCSANAVRRIGRVREMDDLMKVILREKPFMESTGGGVTLSGGEALLYPEFAAALFEACRSEGIPTALDTSGAVPWKNFEKILPLTDLFLFDLKLADPQRHYDLTGVYNERILDNLIRLDALLPKTGAKLWIRTPLIPGETDDPGNLGAIARFIDSELNRSPERWELCSFNPLGADKYARLGMKWAYSSGLMCREEDVKALKDQLAEDLSDPEILRVSGLTSR